MTTAAEFNASGFAAVDKFFGSSDLKEEGEKKTSSGSGKVASSLTTGRRGRGGVGLLAPSSSKTSRTTSAKSHGQNDLNQKILRVGIKKRTHEGDGYDEDDVDGDAGGVGAADDDGSDEEDLGRTAIVREKKASTPVPPSTSKTATKKIGKKERKKLKQLQEERKQPVGAKADGALETDNQDPNTPNTTTSGGDNSHEVAADQLQQQSKQQRKRRKVRSRQKNIRKDNRAIEEMPAHLIPGKRNYQGRPLTQATRERLNLPPSHAVTGTNHHSTYHPRDGAAPLFVIDREPTAIDCVGDDEGVKLAIDDLDSSDDEGEAVGEISGEKRMESTTKDKKRSKKKKRYKNLM